MIVGARKDLAEPSKDGTPARIVAALTVGF